MAGIEPEPESFRFAGGFIVRSYGLFPVRAVSGGIRFGIKFHAVAACFGGIPDHLGHRIDENRHADARFPEKAAYLFKIRKMLAGVPSRIRGDHVFGVGYERDLGRMYFEHEVAETPDGLAFDVEFGGKYGLEGPHVGIADMALVRTGVNRNALGTETFTVDGCFHHVGYVAAACIPQRGDLVDVNT